MSKQKLKIAVFGLGSGELTEQNKIDAFEIGKLIAESGNILLTGLAKGITEFASKGAKSVNGFVIGVNPSLNSEITREDISFSNTDIIVNTGFDDRGRNVVSVRTCDAMIVINGNFGVLNEMTIGVGENKPIIVLKDSGGVAEIIEDIFYLLKPNYEKFKMIENVNEAVPIILKLLEIKEN